MISLYVANATFMQVRLSDQLWWKILFGISVAVTLVGIVGYLWPRLFGHHGADQPIAVASQTVSASDGARVANVVGDNAVVDQSTSYHTAPQTQPLKTLHDLKMRFPERAFIDTSPKDILEDMRGRGTTVQSEAFFRGCYAKKWIIARGAIQDVSYGFNGGKLVTIILNPMRPGKVAMNFDKDDAWMVTHLPTGKRVDAYGEMATASDSLIILDHCGLLD